MKLSIEYVRPIAVIATSEQLDSDRPDTFHETAANLVGEGTCYLVADLTGFDKIDHELIADLVQTVTALAKVDGQLAVVIPGFMRQAPGVQLVLCEPVFVTAHSRDEAIQILLLKMVKDPVEQRVQQLAKIASRRASFLLKVAYFLLLVSALTLLASWLD